MGGYRLVDLASDATLVHGPALQTRPELVTWTNKHFKTKCYFCKKRVQPASPEYAKCARGFGQWHGTRAHRNAGQRAQFIKQPKWCCFECADPDNVVDPPEAAEAVRAIRKTATPADLWSLLESKPKAKSKDSDDDEILDAELLEKPRSKFIKTQKTKFGKIAGPKMKGSLLETKKSE